VTTEWLWGSGAVGPEPQCPATWISIHHTPRDRWSGGQATKAGVLDKSLEPGPVGLCGTAPLWTTCRTTYGGQTVWQVVTALLDSS
jgi:hypothetical protein